MNLTWPGYNRIKLNRIGKNIILLYSSGSYQIFDPHKRNFKVHHRKKELYNHIFLSLICDFKESGLLTFNTE